jgi:hypothetical protein
VKVVLWPSSRHVGVRALDRAACKHLVVDEAVLEYYSTPGRFTTIEDEFSSAEVRDVVGVVQGLLIYDVVAQPFYGVELSDQQADAIHERDSAALLAIVEAVDARPLNEPRPPAHRVGARCHAFSRLTVAFLRAAGIPARARCGFGTYFRPGWFEDHWVAEYWSATDGRWLMADAQLDAVWRKMIGFTGDALSIDPTQFLSAGHAWQAWRRDELDADRCGLSAINQHGSFWIAGNLRLDLASLNKVEMLPWDVWGTGWEPGDQPTAPQLALFDIVADLTTDPDHHFNQIRTRYQTDPSLRMDGTVFNVARGQVEII